MGIKAGPPPNHHPMMGQVWRHIQKRRLYRVLAAANDADNLDYTVCYQCLEDERIWTRRLAIFRERFELVEDCAPTEDKPHPKAKAWGLE